MEVLRGGGRGPGQRQEFSPLGSLTTPSVGKLHGSTEGLRCIDTITHGFRSSFKGWARQRDVDELLSDFALAHIEGSATVATCARDDLLDKRRPVMQAWPTAYRGRGGFQTGHGSLIDSCGVRRLATMHRSSRWERLPRPWA